MAENHIVLRLDDHRQALEELKAQLARTHGGKPQEVRQTTAVADACRVYAGVVRLQTDDRYHETVEAIAADHGLDPADMGFISVVKTALAAYNGYNTGRCWPQEEKDQREAVEA